MASNTQQHRDSDRSEPNANDDELYELVDYTASSPWERFIVSIEQLLQTWGLNDGGLGHFATYNVDKNSNFSYDFKRETISFDDNVYSLLYRVYKPALFHEASIAQHFDQLPHFMTELQRNAFLGDHAACKPATGNIDPSVHQLEFLHRWTGSPHLLILYPRNFSQALGGHVETGFVGSESKTGAIIDFNTAQMLVSSFAIAFQNYGCSIPVLVPTGPSWKSLWVGYQLWKSSYGPKGKDNGVATRYKMTHMMPIPPNCDDIIYLLSHFKQKYRIRG
jgi:hypothetical protein